MLLLPACKSNSDVEEPTLELSTSSLTFAREAGEQKLTVQTNREDSWMATSPKEGEWANSACHRQGQYHSRDT